MKRTLLLKTMLLLWALIVGSLSVWAEDETIATGTFDGKNGNYTTGWTTTGMGKGRNDCIIIGSGENITSPAMDLSKYSEVTISITARRYGTLTGSKATIDASINSSSVGTTEATSTSATTSLTAITFEPTSAMTNVAIVFTCTNATSPGSVHGAGVNTITITGTPASGSGGSSSSAVATTTTIDASGITNTNIYKGTAAGSLSATVKAGENDVEGAIVTWSGNNKEVATINASTGAVTLVAAGTVTFTATYAGVEDEYEPSSDTYEMTVTDIPTHTVTFSVNGVTSTQNFEEGVAIVFPDDPVDVNGKTFVGWYTDEYSHATDAPDYVNTKTATMGNADVIYYAVFAFANGSGSSSVVDELDYEWAGVSGTSYKSWSDKKASSSAVYAGNSAGGNSSIQLKTSGSTSGIVSTTSGGKVAKINVEWNSNTANGRQIDIYGSNTVYENASDLHNSKKQGTKLGTIFKGDAELIVDGDYAYVGIRSYNGALYLDKVSITWSNGGGVSYSDYCTTVVAAAVAQPTIDVAANPFIISTTATITCVTDGATIYYSYDNTNWTEYTETLTITEATTLYAKAMKDETESTVAYVTITKNLAAPTVTIDATSITNTDVFIGTEAGSLAASVTYNDANVEGATVTWSGNDDEVATIDASTGAVTLVAAGTVTFTATYAGNSDYAEKTATYEMTVTNSDPNAPGTVNNPYTVAQAIEATPASGTSSNVYIHGFVSAFYAKDIMSDGSNYRYYISDDGTTDNQLLVYRGKGLDNATFSSADDLQIGDEVVILGDLTTYYGTKEVASGNYIVSLDRPVSTEPSVDVSTNSIEAPAAGADGSIEVTYNNITDVVSEVFFCDSEGNAAVYDWVVAEINNSHNLDYVISENTTASARTAYFKVRALDDEANYVYSELITISQAKPVVMNTYTLATSVVPGRHYIIVGNYNSYKKVMGSQNTNNRRTVDITLNDATASVESEAGAREILISVDENTGYFTLYDEVEGGYLYAACGTGTGNYLKTEKSIDDDGYGLWEISLDNDGKATIKATNGQRNWLRYNSGSDVFSCYASGQRDVYLYERDGDTGSQTVDVNIASACTDNEGYYYGTFSAPYAFIAPADITVSEIGIDEAGKLDVQAYCIEDVVPANTGVMISSTTSGSHTLTVVAGNGTSVMGDGNRLRPTGNEGITATAMDEADPDCVFYRLTMHNKTDLGFYWGAAEGVAFDVVANKAYLAVPKSAGARIQGFSFEDGVITGIRNITPALSEGEGAIFDLQGRRVAKPVNGLYIVNGKKIVIK